MNPDTPSARTSRRSASRQGIINFILAVLIVGMINYVGFKHYKHKDLSLSQFYTLSPKTNSVIKNLDSPVTIYTFLNDGPQADQTTTLLKEYQQAGKNIIVEKIDQAYDGGRAAELQKKLHFDGNDHVIIFTYKDKSPRFLKQDDLFDINPMNGQIGAFKGEQQITAALLALIEGKPSKVYFTQGHGEHSIQDSSTAQGYGFVTASLKNDNVEVENLILAQKGEVPADADAVVIAGPQIAFSSFEADALDKYLQNNGKLYILLDPGFTSGLEAVLAKYGIKFEEDKVLFRAATSSGTEMTLPLALITQGGFASQPITAKFAQSGLQMLIYETRSITLPPTDPSQQGIQSKTQFLLQTDPSAWGWIPKGGTTVPSIRDMTYNKVTDIPGPLTIAAQYDGGMTTDPTTKATMFATRVVAVGASKFLQNDTQEPVGANFFANGIDWLVKKNAVLDIDPKKPQQYGVTLNPISYRTVVWCAGLFIPGAALVLGIATWFSRRK